jgi:hypothetical protein
LTPFSGAKPFVIMKNGSGANSVMVVSGDAG